MPRVSKLRRTPTAPNSKFDAPGSSTLSWSRIRKRQKNWNNPCLQVFKSRSWSKKLCDLSNKCKVTTWKPNKSVVIWFDFFNRSNYSKFLHEPLGIRFRIGMKFISLCRVRKVFHLQLPSTYLLHDWKSRSICRYNMVCGALS